MKDLTIHPKRQAQAWAQQLLSSIQHLAEKEELPFILKEAGIPVEFTSGESKRACQEINLAIRWNNINEGVKWQSTRDQQLKEARETRAGTVITPDYVMQPIPWRVTATSGGSNGTFYLQAAYGQLKRPPRSTKLNALAARMLTQTQPAIKPRDIDPFEKWLGEGNGEHQERHHETN